MTVVVEYNLPQDIRGMEYSLRQAIGHMFQIQSIGVVPQFLCLSQLCCERISFPMRTVTEC
jgi:hypothetical protein